jgi:hypothetical protein
MALPCQRRPPGCTPFPFHSDSYCCYPAEFLGCPPAAIYGSFDSIRRDGLSACGGRRSRTICSAMGRVRGPYDPTRVLLMAGLFSRPSYWPGVPPARCCRQPWARSAQPYSVQPFLGSSARGSGGQRVVPPVPAFRGARRSPALLAQRSPSPRHSGGLSHFRTSGRPATSGGMAPECPKRLRNRSRRAAGLGAVELRAVYQGLACPSGWHQSQTYRLGGNTRKLPMAPCDAAACDAPHRRLE